MEQNEDLAIALAEDDDDLRKLFVHMLRQLGYDVVCAAANGAELLETCFGGKIDVVFVDLDMPIVDGLEAAEEVSKKGIPVVLVSGLSELQDVVADQEPIVARLPKPFTSQDLQCAIDAALTANRLRQPR
jgi:CheY-like chemotaxis protein